MLGKRTKDELFHDMAEVLAFIFGFFVVPALMIIYICVHLYNHYRFFNFVMYALAFLLISIPTIVPLLGLIANWIIYHLLTWPVDYLIKPVFRWFKRRMILTR